MNKVLGCMTLALAAAGVAGCRVDTHKSNGNDDVKIATPFGGMSVKTNDSTVQSAVGIAAYPGATVIKKENGKDSGSADINLSFGGFHLGVKALSYHTDDAPDKVQAYYRKDLARYGSVILCHGRQPVGTPTRTQEGLACDSDRGSQQVRVDDDSKEELKAGSHQHQHIVAIENQGAGTKIGLIAIDLPGGLGGDDDKQ